jgi:hypothetical protein
MAIIAAVPSLYDLINVYAFFWERGTIIGPTGARGESAAYAILESPCSHREEIKRNGTLIAPLGNKMLPILFSLLDCKMRGFIIKAIRQRTWKSTAVHHIQKPAKCVE